MPDMTFTCPECKSSLEIDDTAAGQTVSCPQCAKTIQVPKSSGPPRLSAAAPAQRQPAAPAATVRAASRKTSTGAIWSLVLGVLGLTPCIGLLAALPAVICGHVSLRKIRQSTGALAGDGLAIAGLVLGYVSFALMIVVLPLLSAIAIPSFVKARADSQRHACINNLRIMDAAKEQAAMEHRWESRQEIEPGSAEERSVLEYVKGNRMPVCPAGGQYEWHAIGEVPTCSVPRHALP